jgi:SAM-dependent methyltransferase
VDTFDFWTRYQPGFRFTDAEPGTRAFYDDVERHRYSLEPHILEMAQFDAWRDKDVLDVGCGVATDGVRFARAGARYTGIDQSPSARQLARRRFELEGLDAAIVEGTAASLPFADESFDLVWSHGVIHHMPSTDQAVAEFRRVLRPGAAAVVMLYHRHSLNYVVTIMGIRRVLAVSLLLPGGTTLAERLSRESRAVLEGHRALLRRHGLRYLTDRGLFLSNNTDGPGNPLSKAYTRSEARQLFHRWATVETEVRYLNARLYPGGQRLEQTTIGDRLGRRIGWHLYVRATR